jgi:sugar/nucleoside kinase (ribokinase family)
VSEELTALQAAEPPKNGSILCFGFLTYCLHLVVNSYPEQNAGEAILEEVDSLGDDAAIIACILSKWKVSTQLISSPVGDDDYGNKVTEKLCSSGISVSKKIKPGQKTPLEIAIVDTTGSRTYFQKRESKILSSLIPPSMLELANTRMLYVDWYDGPEVLSTMKRAVSLNIPIFLNIESKYQNNSALIELLNYTTICQISLDEPGAPDEVNEIANNLMDKGVETILITMGAKGCAVIHDGEIHSLSPAYVDVIDCYGAGAAFSAGIIYGIISNWPMDKTARFATAHASLKCGKSGIADFSVEDILRKASDLTVNTNNICSSKMKLALSQDNY